MALCPEIARHVRTASTSTYDVAAVAAGYGVGVELESFVEIPVARQVVVQTDDIRWTGVVEEPLELA